MQNRAGMFSRIFENGGKIMNYLQIWGQIRLTLQFIFYKLGYEFFSSKINIIIK